MKPPLLTPRFILPLSALIVPVSGAVIDITPGNNNSSISQITYDIGGSDVIQNASASGVEHTGDTPAYLKTVRITDGGGVDLPFFNTAGAIVVNVNSQLATKTGIGVFNNGTFTTSTAGSAFADAVASTAMDTNLRNFSFQDYVTPASPPKTGSDYDILFKYALNLEDYLLVSERWGNSSFLVTPLDINGDPYQTANTLRFGGVGLDTGLSYSAYDWNTGYSAATDVPTQAQALLVTPVTNFFENSNGAPVYGVRVEISGITTGLGGIQGEADTKILGISNDTFENNPENPQLIPEPSAFLLSLVTGLFFVSSRKRRKSSES